MGITRALCTCFFARSVIFTIHLLCASHYAAVVVHSAVFDCLWPMDCITPSPLSFAVSWSLLKLIFIESMMCQALDNSQMNSKIPLHGSNFDSLFLLLQFSLSLLYFLSPESWPREPDFFPPFFLCDSYNFPEAQTSSGRKTSFLFYFILEVPFVLSQNQSQPPHRQNSCP